MNVDEELDRLLQRLAASGLSNPLAVVEQLCYLILLRHLNIGWDGITLRRSLNEDREAVEAAMAQLKSTRSDLGPDFTAALSDASLDFPTPEALRNAIVAVDRLWTGEDDARNFERLLARSELIGRPDQVQTPPELVSAMVALTSPRLEDRVFDPGAGTASLLVGALGAMREWSTSSRPARVFGIEIEAALVRIGATNLRLHGVRHPQMRLGDALRLTVTTRAEVVLCHPPFAASVEPGSSLVRLDTKRAELHFLANCQRLLTPGGRCAIVLPANTLFGSTAAHIEVRSRLLSTARVVAVCTLPRGLFGAHANVETALLLFAADGPSSRVWFTQLSHVRDLHDHLMAARRALDAPDATVPQGWWTASLDEIAEREHSLLPTAYGPYGNATAAVEDPRELLSSVRALEADLHRRLEQLDRALES